jgi:hypothetical protein
MAYISNYKNLPKENNRSIGENSPNLVTLIPARAASAVAAHLIFFILIERSSV